MIGISKNTYLLWAAAAALTPTATWHFGPEFGLEDPLHLTFCGSNLAEESNKLLGRVDPIHVEGE